jgi:hypothetical protein
MLFRTAIIAALLAITPALATLNERDVEDFADLSIRSDMDMEELEIIARDLGELPELERRIFPFIVSIH